MVFGIGVIDLGIYGGYFGAGAGIIFLALSLPATGQTMSQAGH